MDAAGLVPVYGEPFDLINGISYLTEGDYKNAGLSAISIIPIASIFKVAKYEDEAADLIKVGRRVNALPESRTISNSVLKELKGMGLDKKFQSALEKGLASRRQGTSGIIDLSQNEVIKKGGYEYIYKLKVPTAGAHTRVYGRIGEDGTLIFDLIKKD